MLRIVMKGAWSDSREMDDLAYFRMRMHQEQRAADGASSFQVRERHQELAVAYELRCRVLMEEFRRIQERHVEEALEAQVFS